jgi:hypothetical protein
MSDLKESAYLKQGAPTQCFFPGCAKPFARSCFHGEDGNYYCSAECALTVDLSHGEPFKKHAR